MAAPTGAEAGSAGVFGRRPTTGLSASARAAVEDASALLRAELALAKAELQAGMQAKALGAALLAGAGALTAVAGLALLLALGFALAELGGLPGWTSALIVAILLLVAAAVLVLLGKRQLQHPVGVDTAKRNLEEDVAWVRRSLGRE